MTRVHRRILARLVVCALAVLLLATATPAAEVALFEFGSSMRYVANSSDPAVGLTWVEPEFDDSEWDAGTYGVGYDNAGAAQSLLLSEVPSGTLSVYSRTTFEITDLSQIEQLVLGVDYDDGFVAWLNGIEIWKAGVPSFPEWDTPASARESSNATEPVYLRFDVSRNIPQLRTGTNVLAVGVWNTHAGSSDLVLAPALWTNTATALTRGPYLQSGTASSIVVRWRTNGPAPSRVLYGTTPGNLIDVAEDPAAVDDHSITLTGLSADTTYYYAVGTDTEILAGDDAEHFFVTAPITGEAKPTRIWVLGDSGSGDANAIAVRDAYYNYTGERNTDLWLMLGDNAYPDGTDLEHQTKLFDIYPEMLRKSVLWPTFGNHDGVSSDSLTQSGPYYDIFTLPANGEAGGMSSGTEAYYSFDYGNIHFVVMDSFESSRTTISPMHIWLEQDLAATAQDWIIAFWHHPPYSKGSHDSDNETPQIEMRQNFVPLLDEYGVDLTLTGHSHSYERSFPIVGHYGVSGTFDESMKVDAGDGREDGTGPYQKAGLGPNPYSGIVHTVAGNAGKLTNGPFDHPAMFLSMMQLGSLIIDVNQTRLNLTFIDENGVIQDYFTIFKGPIIVAPIAEFEALPVAGKVPLQVDFLDQSANTPVVWSWDFQDDGSVDSTNQNPAQMYDVPGIYSVRLTVENVSGVDETLAPTLICAHQGPPTDIGGMRFFDPITMQWDPVAAATHYDLVKGDLATLRSSGGDFLEAQSACLEDDDVDVRATDPQTPLTGEGFFYIARGTNCAAQTGSFDTLGDGQAASRDPGLQGLSAECLCDLLDDLDLDGYCNSFDDCTDGDGDGIGDPGFEASTCGIDNCPTVVNPDQDDADNDLIGDVCDVCPDDADDDIDGDTVCGNLDNCPLVANLDQSNLDGDMDGDACDGCTDPDGDFTGNPGLPASTCPEDNCTDIYNPNQEDADSDLIGDVCDACPMDTNNDIDLDGLCADVDNCPSAANADQADGDGDSVGDVCDVCPNDAFDDADDDGWCADVDNCPGASNANQADYDSDGIGDECDLCNDTDDDGFGNLGFPRNNCPPDNCPYRANPDQLDSDLDGKGDECDICPFDALDDVDFDFTCGDIDNCPTTYNPDQADSDADDIGNSCDACPNDALNDVDLDAVCGNIDNCPATANTDQANFDGDGAGDACDADDDNDGYDDETDCAQFSPGVAEAPAEVGPTIRMSRAQHSRLEWLPSFQGHTYNIYRTQVQVGASFLGTSFGCFANEVTTTSKNVPQNPAPNELWAFLIAARNECADSGLSSGFAPDPVCAPSGADSDNDGLADVSDNCPTTDNAAQLDTDGDFVGNVCDNCPVTFNPDQADSDGDGSGDACGV